MLTFLLTECPLEPASSLLTGFRLEALCTTSYVACHSQCCTPVQNVGQAMLKKAFLYSGI